MPSARPERPAWSEPSPQARNSTSSLFSHAVVSIVDAVVEHPVGLDADDEAVDRRVERLPVVTLRKLADVLVRALFVQLDRTFDFEVPVGIFVIPDADADARGRPAVPALVPLLCGVYTHRVPRAV